MKRKLTENLYVHEFATSNGELNIDIAYLLALQAFRSWLGVPLYFGKGCGCRANLNNSAHNIYMYEDTDTPFDPEAFNKTITIPMTGSDPHAKEYDSWELMAKLEKWIEQYKCEVEGYTSPLTLVEYYEGDDPVDELIKVYHPIFTGRGVYPDSKSGFIHADMGQNSLNKEIRDKRKSIKRWVALASKDPKKRKRGIWDYHYARDGEGFAEMRGRLGL